MYGVASEKTNYAATKIKATALLKDGVNISNGNFDETTTSARNNLAKINWGNCLSTSNIGLTENAFAYEFNLHISQQVGSSLNSGLIPAHLHV